MRRHAICCSNDDWDRCDEHWWRDIFVRDCFPVATLVVDNLAVNAVGAVPFVPEPSTFVLAGIGLVGLVAAYPSSAQLSFIRLSKTPSSRSGFFVALMETLGFMGPLTENLANELVNLLACRPGFPVLSPARESLSGGFAVAPGRCTPKQCGPPDKSVPTRPCE